MELVTVVIGDKRDVVFVVEMRDTKKKQLQNQKEDEYVLDLDVNMKIILK